jgi:hypothetical protein
MLLTDLLIETDDLLATELATPREKAVENAVIGFVFVKGNFEQR